MIDIDEFSEILSDVLDELPEDFFHELHQGVIVSEEVRISPHARNDDLVIMGEYHASRYGNQIVIYYGSFARNYPAAGSDFIRERLREVVRHEFRHHMENLGGMHGADSLEHEDKVSLREYLRSTAK